MEGQTWDNITNREFKMKDSDQSYSLPNCKSCVMAMKVHTINYSDIKSKDQQFQYLTFSTFDGLLVILENQNPFGRFNNNRLSFSEKLKLKTTYPIADFYLEVQQNLRGQNKALIGYFVDVFSNLYSLNLTINFGYLDKISSSLQPAKPAVLFFNIFPKDVMALKLQYPVLLHKHDDYITTLSLGGTLRTFNKSEEKSWLHTTQIEPKTHEFNYKVIAANSSKPKDPQSNTVVIAFHNRYLPYPFVDCSSCEQFQTTAEKIEAYYQRWYDVSEQIIFCQYDPYTKRVCTALITTEVEIYEIKKKASLGVCEKIFRFMPIDISQSQLNHIECLDTNRGILLLATCKEVVIFDLQTFKIRKRLSGQKKSKSAIQKMSWSLVLEKENENMTYILSKGFNHRIPEQSKLGKPNLHFRFAANLPKHL